MRIFVAGATSALGTRLVPLLVQRGHEVVAMTRSAQKTSLLRDLGADAAVADGLDAAVMEAVKGAMPEVVIHQLTGLASLKSFKNFDDEFADDQPASNRGYRQPAGRSAGCRRTSIHGAELRQLEL